MIEFQKVSVKYPKVYGICDIDKAIENCTKLCISAENGSGKATLLRTIAGLEKYSGSLKIDGVERSNLSNENLDIVYIPEIPVLNTNKSIEANLQYVQTFRNIDKKTLEQSLEKLGLDKEQKVCELSLFDKYRLSIIRAGIRTPKYYLVEDIFKNLNENECKTISKMINDNIKKETTVIIAMSNQSVHSQYFPDYEIVQLKNGYFFTN